MRKKLGTYEKSPAERLTSGSSNLFFALIMATLAYVAGHFCAHIGIGMINFINNGGGTYGDAVLVDQASDLANNIKWGVGGFVALLTLKSNMK